MWPLLSFACSFGLTALLARDVTHGAPVGYTSSLFFQFAFVGSLVIFAASKRSLAALAITVILGVTLFAGSVGVGGKPATPFHAVISVFAFFGAGSLFVGGATEQGRWTGSYIAMLMLPGLMVLNFLGFALLPSDRITSIDRYLYMADRYLGNPSFAVGRVFAAVPGFDSVCRFVYVALPLAPALIYAQLPENLRGRFASTLVLAGVIGFCLYRLFPAAGPLYAFHGDFPLSAPILTSEQMHRVILPRVRLNAMPSLHFTWALLSVCYGWKTSVFSRVWLAFFLALTVLATLGTGEHYGVDLIGAIPLAAGVHWLGRRTGNRVEQNLDLANWKSQTAPFSD